MTHQHRIAFKAALDEPSSEGRFSGYASVFDVEDYGGDVVERGAFQEFDLTRDGFVKVLYQHDPWTPIGKAKVWQDERGLAFDGRLLLGVSAARDAHALMKSHVLDGMSFGYDVLESDRRDGRRYLQKLKLWEISPVTWGMNPHARINSTKQLIDCADIRSVEEMLREQHGLSRRKAAGAASALWPFIRERDAHDDDREDRHEAKASDRLLVEIQRLTSILTQSR